MRRASRLFRRRRGDVSLERWYAKPIERARRKACHLQEAVTATRGLGGAVVECGVASAGSLIVLSHAVLRSDDARSIVAVDSFEGFPDLSEHDGDWFDPRTMKPHYRKFDVEFVRANLSRSGLQPKEVEQIRFEKGWIPDVLAGVPEPISLLHLDVDLYQPYADSLRVLWPQLQPGAWVLFDEYDQGRDEEKWPGAKRAIDEFLATKSLSPIRHWSGFSHVVKVD